MADAVQLLPKSQTKSMPKFLATLRDEHRYFQSLIDIGREQLELLEKDGKPDLDILQDVLRYLAEYPEDSHHPREDLMFERVLKLHSPSSSQIDKLVEGHVYIHDMSNKLYVMAMRANNGENIRRKVFARDLRCFFDGYEKHMHEEDEIVFVRALAVLDDADWADLDARLEDIDDPLFGTRVRRRYRRLANVLDAKLGVAKRDLVAAEYLGLGALIESLVIISETTINVGFVVYDRTGQTLRENLATARDGIRSRRLTKILGLPFQLGGNSLQNLRGGIGEAKVIVSKAAEQLKTPYNMRMDALKDILREDFGTQGRSADN